MKPPKMMCSAVPIFWSNFAKIVAKLQNGALNHIETISGWEEQIPEDFFVLDGGLDGISDETVAET